MADKAEASLTTTDLPEIVRKIRARTPARLLVGRAGASYRTNTQLDLREAHAAARDAVRAELNPEETFGSAFMRRWRLFETRTKAGLKEEFLLRPDLGRKFDDESRTEVKRRCSRDNDLQIAIGDGLSVSAIAAQVPALLPLLCAGGEERHWRIGQTFVIHHCRVGILNEIGELLNPRVAILLIGERPGLATAESLSAYMAYQPRDSHTDANRNLVSNIHARGLCPQDAAVRILNLATRMMKTATSGYLLKEEHRALKDC
ncbi:MAG: ethanolamine ammonia-lyase subunit EutC [Candidatus Acidiferrales bacterium]